MGHIFGPYICGDSIDIKNNVLLTGSYSGHNLIQLWDLRTFKLLENVNWDEMNDQIETNIFSAQFSKKGKNLFAVASSNTNHVKIYDYGNQNKLYAGFKFLNKPIYTLDFSNNGKFIAYGGAEGNINIASL